MEPLSCLSGWPTRLCTGKARLYSLTGGASPWATNENLDGYDLRFRSSEYSGSSYRPKLVVTYKRQFNYVYYLKDHLGNIRVTVDKDGEVLGYDDFYPFGLQMPGRSSNTANPNHLYKYSSKELDEEIGLDWYYFGARYYDPEIGRWMAVDPLAGKYPSISPYVYCANSSLVFIDPTGETWVYVATSDTTGYYQWVDDGKHDLVITTSDIVNQNKNDDGEINWSGVSNAKGSTTYSFNEKLGGDENNSYWVITGVIQGGYKLVSGEFGSVTILDNKGNIYEYAYGALGIGLSTVASGMAGFEVGGIETSKSPHNLGGWFYGISGMTAAGPGASFSWTFSGFFSNPMFTTGGGAGGGAGINMQGGYMRFIKKRKNFFVW